MNNATTNNSKSNLPLLIIGAVLLIAIVGGWLWYSSSSAPKPAARSANTVGNSNKPSAEAQALEARKIYDAAPAGANPPNMLGSPTATVTVEEFADYQCPTCATVHPMMQEIVKTYGNRIKFIYRSFPLTQIHPHAYEAATAAEAAGLQNKFWEMQTQLFTNQKEWSNSPEAAKLFEGYAQKIGMDVEKYKNDVLGLLTKGRVDADLMRGRKIGIGGTPAIYINGVSLPFQQFNVESMRQAIDTELQKAGNQPATSQTSNQAVVVNQTTGNTANASNNSAVKPDAGNSK